MLLRELHLRGVWGCGLNGFGGFSLRLDQLRHKAQVVADRVAVGLLLKPRRTFSKQLNGLGQTDALLIGVVQGFDLAWLKNALHCGETPKKLPLSRSGE